MILSQMCVLANVKHVDPNFCICTFTFSYCLFVTHPVCEGLLIFLLHKRKTHISLSPRYISPQWRRASSTQCAIVYEYCADPQHVLFDICGIPAKFSPDYPYHWETDWWEVDIAPTRIWAGHRIVTKTYVPHGSHIPVEPITRSEIR